MLKKAKLSDIFHRLFSKCKVNYKHKRERGYDTTNSDNAWSIPSQR
jgi:hypothetical protein